VSASGVKVKKMSEILTIGDAYIYAYNIDDLHPMGSRLYLVSEK